MTTGMDLPRSRGVTRSDVARLAGVSTAVVSYALNGGPRPIAAATREKVLDAARMLGYRPNAAARALSRGQSDLLALVVPTVEQAYFAHLAGAVETAAREAGLSLLIASAMPAHVGTIVHDLIGQQLRGLVLAAEATADATAEILSSRLPTVLINQAAPAKALQTLGPDFRGGAREAVRHLIEVHDHRRIAYVGADVDADERAVGWREALRRAGLEADAVVDVPFSHAGGREAVGILSARHPDVTAAFFASDQLAIGAIAGLADRGRRAPDDLAMVAFDGSPEAEYAVPALTTVDVPIAGMAKDAVAMLLDAPAPGHRNYDVELLVRRSCGCPAPASAG